MGRREWEWDVFMWDGEGRRRDDERVGWG